MCAMLDDLLLWSEDGISCSSSDQCPGSRSRHQADVAHAYQVLKKGGVPDDHIVRSANHSFLYIDPRSTAQHCC